LAILLVVMFRPLYQWFRDRCGTHGRIAAALTTGAILLMVLIPLLLLLVEAGREAEGVYSAVVNDPTVAAASGQQEMPDMDKFADWASQEIVNFGKRLGLQLDPKDIEARFTDSVQQFLAPMALRTTRMLGEILVGLFVMILATYYFFADGDRMVQAIWRLSPLEGSRTQELLDQFDAITRAVVVATLASAFIQGVFAGVGFYFVGVSSVFLLTALCMLFTLVPFVGAAIIWVPVCLWLYAIEGRTLAAVFLTAYCILVISTVDNVVKPLVLHGRSNLHPLLALLSVLGGVQAIGPIGIFVGPMVVAFLQTLLNMVHAELSAVSAESGA
jgi:predicted PurR-regulated permease PerM